jgi:DNA-binding GntR family transcriptional regulator
MSLMETKNADVTGEYASFSHRFSRVQAAESGHVMSSSQTKRERPMPIPTLSDFIRGHIRDAILSGQYAMGTKIDQQGIADELGVSIIPVRESLRQLQADGLVENHPHRGVFVTELSLTDLHNIYVVRETLEELASQLAVTRLSTAVLDTMSTQIDAMQSATEQNNFNELFDLNRTFHFTLYNRCENNVLIQMIESMWDRSTVYRRMYTHMPDRVRQALEEHKAILQACVARDSAQAGRAVRENVQQTTRGIMARIEKEKASQKM